MIRIENLVKAFGAKRAVDGVSFAVERGEVLGFLGPNGAGKSTTMRMITGYFPPSSGRVWVGGHDVAEAPLAAKRLIGYLPEAAPSYPDMTVEGFLAFAARMRGLEGAARRQAIARLTSEWEVIVVPAGSPHKTMGDLLKAFKADPGAVSWGGGSAGGTDHILVGLIAKEVGVAPARINYVPFKGGGEAIAAIVGGHVTAGVSGVGEFAEQIKGGRMRALGVSAPGRVEGIPSLKEQGIDVELGNWRGIFAAPGIGTAQRDALVKLVKDATETAAWKATLAKLGWSGEFLGGDGYAKFLAADTVRIAGIIDSLGIKRK